MNGFCALLIAIAKRESPHSGDATGRKTRRRVAEPPATLCLSRKMCFNAHCIARICKGGRGGDLKIHDANFQGRFKKLMQRYISRLRVIISLSYHKAFQEL